MKRNFQTFAIALLLIILSTSIYGYFHKSISTQPGISTAKFVTLHDYQSQKLKWSACDTNLQCTTMVVPVDYAKIVPNQSFSLFILRHPATSPTTRLGSLLVNPGGPGGSGVDYAFNWESILSSAVSNRYDIVGFDQRGIGHSEPIRCLTDPQEDALLSGDGKVTGKSSLKSAIASARDFANKCALAAGKRLGHYSTLDGARDMELLRGLLGDAKLNYLGKSYGTYLGTLYANLYPTHVGKMVLDGAIDPKESLLNQNLYQAKGFELALTSFLQTHPMIIKKNLASAIDQLASHPIKSDKRTLTQALAVTGIASGLYDPLTGWPELSTALTDLLQKRSATTLLAMADSYNNRDSAGHFVSNQSDLQTVISCLDFTDPRSVEQMSADQPLFTRAAPTFGPYLVYAGLACKFWRAPPSVTTDFTALRSVPPILVIGVTRDPATPYIWAQSLHHEFAQSVLLTFVGDGHTGHNRGSACIDSKVDAYLITGVAPTGQVNCKAA